MPARPPSIFARTQFSDPAVLAGALQRADTVAIEWILAQTENAVGRLLRRAGLPADALPDVLHDGVLVLIKKIRAGAFDAAQSHPKTYLVGICKNLIHNRLRAKKLVPTLPLDHTPDIPNLPDASFSDGLENLRQIEALLLRLGEPCSQLVRLKYLDELRDDEVIARKLTHFATIASLKNARSKCMKKLLDLAKTFTGLA
ncbi:MAG: RNA polymerase sigma factor [Saprospiraceae bacterium]